MDQRRLRRSCNDGKNRRGVGCAGGRGGKRGRVRGQVRETKVRTMKEDKEI